MSTNIFSKYGRVNYRYDEYDNQIVFKISTDLHAEFYDTPVIELIINGDEPSVCGGCIVKDGIIIYRNNEIYFCKNGKDWSIFSNYTLCTTIQLPDNYTVADIHDQVIDYDEDHNLIYCYFPLSNYSYIVFAAFDVSRSKYVIPYMHLEEGAVYPITGTGYVFNGILYMPYENSNETNDPRNRYRMWKYSISSGELIEDVSYVVLTDSTIEVTTASKYGFYKYVATMEDGRLEEIYWSTDNQSWNHITINELLEYIPSLNTLDEYFLSMDYILYRDHLELYSIERRFVCIYADLGIVTFPIDNVANVDARCGDTFIFTHSYDRNNSSYFNFYDQYSWSVLTRNSDINITKSYLDMYLNNTGNNSNNGSNNTYKMYCTDTTYGPNFGFEDNGQSRFIYLDDITPQYSFENEILTTPAYEIIPESKIMIASSANSYDGAMELSDFPNIVLDRLNQYKWKNPTNGYSAHRCIVTAVRVKTDPIVVYKTPSFGSSGYNPAIIDVNIHQIVEIEWNLQYVDNDNSVKSVLMTDMYNRTINLNNSTYSEYGSTDIWTPMSLPSKDGIDYSGSTDKSEILSTN